VIVIKSLILLSIFVTSTALGIMLANKYKDRVTDLKQMRSALNILKTKIVYTYEPLPEIFLEISSKFTNSIGEIFKLSSSKMKEKSAGTAWKEALLETKTNMNKEDLKTIESLSKLLGKTDVDGQLSEIELLEKFIDEQIEKAEGEQRKNEKLYKSLGVIAGLAIAIILI